MMSDKQLQADFLELVNRCRGSIIRVCLIYTDRRPENVKDLFQDIVYDLWRGFPQLRDRSKAHSWVYSSALNTARMHHRTRQRQPDFVELDDATINSYIEQGLDEPTEILYRLIGLLDKDDQELILLYIDRVPQKKIAHIYHTTVLNINKRISRIKKKLKKMYENGR